MYEMKTLLPQFDIQLPTCMYEMKSLTTKNKTSVQVSSVFGYGNPAYKFL